MLLFEFAFLGMAIVRFAALLGLLPPYEFLMIEDSEQPKWVSILVMPIAILIVAYIVPSTWRGAFGGIEATFTSDGVRSPDGDIHAWSSLQDITFMNETMILSFEATSGDENDGFNVSIDPKMHGKRQLTNAKAFVRHHTYDMFAKAANPGGNF